MDLRRVPRLVARVPRALVQQHREVHGLAEAMSRLESRLDALHPAVSSFNQRSWPLSCDVELVRGEEGLFLVHSRDVGISQVIRTTGVWSPHDVKLFRSLIRPGDHVIDVGANLGHHTVAFSAMAGPAGRVLAIEPQTVMFRLIGANLLLNGCGNVTVERCAVGEDAGVVQLYPADYSVPGNYGTIQVTRMDGKLRFDHPGEVTPVYRLDDLVAKLDWKRVDFLKVDAQTYDLYVLQGSETTLRSMRPVVFVEIAPYWMRMTGYDYREIYRLLLDMGYTVFEPHVSLTDPASIREWSGDNAEEWDLLAVPEHRLQSLVSPGGAV